YGGDALELKISKVNKLSYKEMCDLLVEKVNEDIWHWFYCKPDCCLEKGLTIVKNDRDVKIMYEMADLHGHLEVDACMGKKEQSSPCYLISPNPLKAKCFPIDLKGKSLSNNFEKVEGDGEGLGSSSSKFRLV
nr:transposase, MuDR, MULE transposase domain protein [Tanacetum cinerariifolium]